jgi:hypothetical protein
MLDPLTALSLAANIAQLVNLAAEVLSSTAEINRHGSAVAVADLNTLTNDLVDSAATLRAHNQKASAFGSSLAKEELIFQFRRCMETT